MATVEKLQIISLENIILGQRKMWEYQTECWAFKKLSVTRVVFSSFFSRVIFLMSPQIVCLKWCKVAKIAFPRFFSRLISNVYANALLETMLNQITPKRPQITPDHTRNSQKHAFGSYFLAGPRQTIFLHCPPPLPKPREPPNTSNGLSVTGFRFKSEKKTYQWYN